MEPPDDDEQYDDGAPTWRDDEPAPQEYDDDPGDGPRRGVILAMVLALVLVAGAALAIAVSSDSDDDGDDDSELSVDESTTTTVRRTTTTTARSTSTSVDPSDGTSTTIGVGGGSGSTTTTTKPGGTTTTLASSGNTTAPGTDSKLDALWNACRDGDMQSCDQLYGQSTKGTAYSEFGDTCGNRRAAGGGYCLRKADRPMTYGDDPQLDGLYDRCTAGELAACDQLYLDSYAGSQYEQHALTCGGRNAPTGSCVANAQT